MKFKKITCGLALCTLALTSCGSKFYSINDYMLELPWKDNFRILQLSDIHLANKDEQDLQLKFLKLTIEAANADLIVCTGDLFTFADKNTAITLFTFLDSFSIPWTVTFGNHDEQCYFSIDWMTGYLNDMSNSKDHYCYFKDIQDDKVFGNANFAINLVETHGDQKDIHTQVIIMDSNRYNYGEYWGYDYIKTDQINWYKELTDECKTRNGGIYVPSLLFFHIPLPEFETAWQQYQSHVPGVTYLGGEAGEGVSCPDVNSGFFDVLKTRGSKGIFVGHDHVNDWAIEYQGVLLSYGVTSTDRIYRNPEKMGGTVITVGADNTLGIERIYKSYEEIK